MLKMDNHLLKGKQKYENIEVRANANNSRS